MTVVCAACGKASRDREFCDHCNADLQAVGDGLPPPRCPLPDGPLELTSAQRKTLSRIDASVTVPAVDDQLWRVHWVPASEQQLWRPLLADRISLDLPVLPLVRTVEAEQGQWVLAPAAASLTPPWHDRPPIEDPVERIRRLLADVASLAYTMEQLHRQGCVWLNFDPAAIEEIGTLATWIDAEPAEPGMRLWRITNLDVRLYRRGECPPSLNFNAKYAPPEVCAFRASEIGPATDVYHLALFAYYWCAGLLPEGFRGAGLESFDHHVPPLRPFAPDLPEGLIPAIMRGVTLESRRRYDSPQDFVGALRQQYDEAQRRRRCAGPVYWDAGAVTEAGRSKKVLNKGNEDHCLLRAFPEQGAVLAAVADGISTCDIGSGALASLVATIILENRFDNGSSHEAFAQQIAAASQEGSQRVLDWAIEKGYREQLAMGLDLMGTTLTVAWLEARQLSTANLGDSRVYLFTDQWVDQLTVDGDLGTELLSRGTPPEQVLRMGVVARALRTCVGGCTISNGELTVLAESCQPTVARWPIVPGDIIVLCTDGLIEESLFLEPEAAAQLIRTHRDQPAAELARRLVEAADSLQRLPSVTEPEGFGDNITCVVIKIEGSGE
jgi:serine/threonine protein phosphatase PrpC